MNRQLDGYLPSMLRRFWPIILLALVPCIPLYRAIFMGEAIGPFDQIRQMAPWNGAKPSQPWDVLQADGVLQFYVWRDLVFDAWGNGQIPFWNSYQLAGTPLLGNSQSGALYPLHIAMGILHISTATAMTLLAWFHLFWAGLGTYFLARKLGANKVGGSVAGMSFSLSSFMIAWTGLPSVIETVAWIPWALTFLVFLLDRPISPYRGKFLRSHFEISSSHLANLSMIALGISTGMMILAGHLQFVAYGFIGMATMALWMVVSGLTRRITNTTVVGQDAVPVERTGNRNHAASSALRTILGLIIGLCIAAPQLLSVLNYSQFSHRKNTPSEDGYTAFSSSAIQTYELVKLAVPTLQGNPRQQAEGLPISTYYPALLKPGANYAESAIGLGIFTVLLLFSLPLLAKMGESVWGIMVVGLFGFLIALGTPINRLFYFGVPGWSSTGSPGRAIVLVTLAASVGAGVAASRLPSLRDQARKIPILGGVLIGCLIVLMVLKNGYTVPNSIDPSIVRNLKEQAESASLSGYVGILLISAAAWALAAWKDSILSKALVVSVPILGCIACFGMTLVQTGLPDLKVTQNLGTQRVAAINSNWDIFTAQHATLPPNLAALNRVHSLDGYDSLLHRDTVALLHDIDGRDPAPPANGNMMFIKPTADFTKLSEAGVTEVWSQKPLATEEIPRKEDGLLKYALKGPGRASTPQGPAEIVSETTSSLKLHAVGPGRLVVRERNMPGWAASVDDRATSIAGSTWLEMELPSGDHQITLSYTAPGFSLGIYLCLLAWIIVFMLAFGPWLIARGKLRASRS